MNTSKARGGLKWSAVREYPEMNGKLKNRRQDSINMHGGCTSKFFLLLLRRRVAPSRVDVEDGLPGTITEIPVVA